MSSESKFEYYYYVPSLAAAVVMTVAYALVLFSLFILIIIISIAFVFRCLIRKAHDPKPTAPRFDLLIQLLTLYKQTTDCCRDTGAGFS